MITRIGDYQFQNLLRAFIPFAFFDLRNEATRIKKFHGAVSVTEATLFEVVPKACPALEFPILLICETGALSEKLGLELAAKGYKNVTVLEGGIQ